MDRFILASTCPVGFHGHAIIDLQKPIVTQLNRRRLYPWSGSEVGDDRSIKKIIEQNASLRISFGWSFESTMMFEQIMSECINEIVPKFNESTGNMCSDNRCDWLGFLPFNAFERIVYEDLSLYSLILFNNELIDFQTAVVEFITGHTIYRQHAIVRDHRYRFHTFRNARLDPVALSDLFIYYIDAVRDTSLISRIPRDMIEEQIGCHFLYHPDVFFEMLNFHKLKGEISE